MSYQTLKERERLERNLSSYEFKLEKAGSFSERVEVLAEMVGGLNALSRLSGISISGLKRYLEGGEPTLSKLLALAESTGFCFDWLGTGSGSMRPGDSPGGAIDIGLFNQIIQLVRSPDSELREASLDVLLTDILATYNIAVSAPTKEQAAIYIEHEVAYLKAEALRDAINQLNFLMKEAPENAGKYAQSISQLSKRLKALESRMDKLALQDKGNWGE